MLLILGNLFWSGNIVLGRGIAGKVPPIALAYWRWTGAFCVAFVFAWPYLKRDFPILLRQWPRMLLLSATGIASYNTMSYIGLTTTTALNVLLLQSAQPLFIIIWAYVLYREAPTARQSAGIVISLLGVTAIAGRGSLQALANLHLNPGDLWVLAALLIYGIYAVVLRNRPAVHPLSFLVTAMGIGSCMMLPFYLWEYGQGGRIEVSPGALASLTYVAVFPSFISYMFFNRAVELIGGSLAGQSTHLMPLFGSILAVLFLGESFQTYHAAGIALITAGILLATLKPGSFRSPAPTTKET